MCIHVPVNTMPCLFCVMCNVSWRYMYCKYYYLGLDKYGHLNDVILNWHQVYSIGGATHTYTILIIAHVPMIFYVKKAAYI